MTLPRDVQGAPGGPGTPPAYAFVVYGTPAPQGSKRAIVHKTTGKAVVMESSAKRLKPWRQDVKQAALMARGIHVSGAIDPRPPLVGPLAVSMVFTVARPRHHYRTGRNAHLLRDAAPIRPAGMPDLSKLARAAEDSLTDAGLWADDRLVVEYVRLAKVYPGEDRDALDMPGARISVWQVDAIDWPEVRLP